MLFKPYQILSVGLLEGIFQAPPTSQLPAGNRWGGQLGAVIPSNSQGQPQPRGVPSRSSADVAFLSTIC